MPKILIVDDSALMRRLLTKVFEQEGDFEIRSARDGEEAIKENLAFEPDVITLDINMPVMDGLTALSNIMTQRPVPVIMVSSLTEKGALATFEALNLGAVDYLAKPGGTISLSINDIRDELVGKVRSALRVRLKKKEPSLISRLKTQREEVKKQKFFIRKGISTDERIILIGVSTGGPKILEDILQMLPEDFPVPIVVAQHMPQAFTKPFADRLNTICNLNVVEVDRPMQIEAGHIYIGRGNADVIITRRIGKLTVISKPENPSFLWHPSVDLLGHSALEHCDASQLIAVLLTGMGYDGAEAFKTIMEKGGKTIAESEETAVVFGMPQVLIEKKGATVILPSYKIAEQLIKWVKGSQNHRYK